MANIHGLEETSDFIEYDYDPTTGIRHWIRIEDGGDTMTLRMTQDVDAVLEAAQHECNLTDKHTRYGDLARVGTIPMSMLYDDNFGLRSADPDALKRFLRDPNFSKFRTRVGDV